MGTHLALHLVWLVVPSFQFCGDAVLFSFLAPHVEDTTLNYGPLALVAPLLQELRIASIMDHHLVADPRVEFSHGQVLSLLLAARLCEPNALIHIPNWAHTHGADILWGIPAEKLNDDRLGRALDAFFTKRHSIMADATLRALELTDLSLNRLHFDTTDLHFCGTYQDSVPRPLPDDLLKTDLRSMPSDCLLPPAHITKGYLSDRRMIHVGVTSVVDDQGCVPIFCHPVDGNRNGYTAIHEQFELLDDHLSLPQGMQLVSDRGTYSVEHVARLNRHGHSFLGAVPWNDFQDLYDRQANKLKWQEASYLSQEQQRRRLQKSALPLEHYEIACVKHELQDPTNGKPLPCRVIFCYSSAGAAEEQKRREENIVSIREGFDQIAEKLRRGHPRTTYASAVGQIAKLLGKKSAARYFNYELVPLTSSELKALPAPSKGYRRPTHRLVYTCDLAAAQADTAYDGLSALLTSSPLTKSADTLFTEYKQQPYVELAHHQFKTPLQVRPIFLKTPQRVEALVCLMYLALQAYQMLERRYRQQTPADAPKKERRMTAERLLKAFDVYGITIRKIKGGQVLFPARLFKQQREILDRLGFKTPHQLLAKVIPLAPTG
jgi:transposase